MSKLRIKNKYGVAPNELLNDPEISLKAKGLFTYLQSKPDGWNFAVNRIQKESRDGKDGTASAVRELEKSGYLKRVKRKNRKGLWVYEYILSENPVTDNPSLDKPSADTPSDNKEIDSNKEEVRNNITISPVGAEVNEIISLFEPLNPQFEELFKRPHERKAAEWLIKKAGFSGAVDFMKKLPAMIALPYTPLISTPRELKEKMGKLKQAMKNADKNKKPKVAKV